LPRIRIVQTVFARWSRCAPDLKTGPYLGPHWPKSAASKLHLGQFSCFAGLTVETNGQVDRYTRKQTETTRRQFCTIRLWLLYDSRYCSTHTHTHPFNGLFSMTAWVSRYRKGKISLDLNEARVDGVLACSGISWTLCKQSPPCNRQVTTPTPHHSIFTWPDALPGAHPTVSKH